LGGRVGEVAVFKCILLTTSLTPLIFILSSNSTEALIFLDTIKKAKGVSPFSLLLSGLSSLKKSGNHDIQVAEKC
jgi:hypothetical protein